MAVSQDDVMMAVILPIRACKVQPGPHCPTLPRYTCAVLFLNAGRLVVESSLQMPPRIYKARATTCQQSRCWPVIKRGTSHLTIVDIVDGAVHAINYRAHAAHHVPRAPIEIPSDPAGFRMVRLMLREFNVCPSFIIPPLGSHVHDFTILLRPWLAQLHSPIAGHDDGVPK